MGISLVASTRRWVRFSVRVTVGCIGVAVVVAAVMWASPRAPAPSPLARLYNPALLGDGKQGFVATKLPQVPLVRVQVQQE